MEGKGLGNRGKEESGVEEKGLKRGRGSIERHHENASNELWVDGRTLF